MSKYPFDNIVSGITNMSLNNNPDMNIHNINTRNDDSPMDILHTSQSSLNEINKGKHNSHLSDHESSLSPTKMKNNSDSITNSITNNIHIQNQKASSSLSASSSSSSSISLSAPKPKRTPILSTTLFANSKSPIIDTRSTTPTKFQKCAFVSGALKKNTESSNYSSRSVSPLNTDESQLIDNHINSQESLLGIRGTTDNSNSYLPNSLERSRKGRHRKRQINQPKRVGHSSSSRSRSRNPTHRENFQFHQNRALVLELDLNGIIKFISRSWESIVGTNIAKIVNKPMSQLIIGEEEDKSVFEKAINIMIQDDETYRIRFITPTNLLDKKSDNFDNNSDNITQSPPISCSSGDSKISDKDANETETLNSTNDNSDNDSLSIHSNSSTITTDGGFIELEAQGILIHDKNDQPTHSMWIVKPWIPIQSVAFSFSEDLVSTIGSFGVNLLESYMLQLTDLEVTDESYLPSPSLELCRICEERVPNWWLEKHSELCLIEHRVEDMVYIKQEELQDHRKLLHNILETLHKKHPQSPVLSPSPSSTSTLSNLGLMDIPVSSASSISSVSSSQSESSTSSGSVLSISDYKGFPIPYGPQMVGVPPSRRKSAGTLFPQIRFPFKNIENLIAYCDEALKINPGEIRFDNKESTEQCEIVYSPDSANALKALNELSFLSSSDPAIQQLTEDTKNLVEEKLEKLERYAHILQYVDRITKETNDLVIQTVNNTIKKIKEHVFNISESESENDCTSIKSNRILTPNLNTPKSTSFSQPNNNITFNNVYLDTYSPNTSREDLRFGSTLGSGNSTPRNLSSVVRKSNPLITVLGEETSRIKRVPTNNSFSTPKRPTSPGSILSLSKSVKKNEMSTSSPFSSPLLQYVDSSRLTGAPALSLSNLAANSDKPPLSPLLVPTTVKHSVPSIKDYEIVKPISKGAFGSVFLAKRKLTGDYFAIKVLKKSDMIAKNQVTNVKAERAIMMAQSNSEHVVQLIASFQSTHYLYLVMEYLNGGDLATLLHNMNTLPDVWAKRYIAEVIVGVNDLHLQGIVHRDLKPDNFLIDRSGHVKLTDFGLSRMGLVSRQKAVAKYQAQNIHQRALSQSSGLSARNSFSSNRSASGLGLLSPGSLLGMQPSSNPGSISINNSALSNSEVVTVDNPFQANSNLSLDRNDESFSLNSFKSPDDTLSDKDSIKDYYPLNNIIDGKHEDTKPCPITRLQHEYGARARRLSSASQSSQASDSHYNAANPLASPINTSKLSNLKTITQNISNSSENDADSSGHSIEVPKDFALFDPDHSTQARKFVGTPDYLAPETVAGLGQDASSDWWSIGCILFEFLFGYPPFNDDTPDKVFNNILYGEIQWPHLLPDQFKMYCSDTARDLIEKLLIKDPTQRLGSGGSEEIMNHPYFEGICWDTLFDEEASFVPEVEHPESTDYFDQRGATMNSFPVDDEIESANMENNNNNVTYTKSANDKDIGYSEDFENDAEESDNEEDEEDEAESEDDNSDVDRFYNNPDEYMMKRSDSSSNTINSTKLSFSTSSPQMLSSRERRSSRLNDAGNNSEFGSFQFRNLMVLEKQNKDAINRLKSEHLEHRNSISSITSSDGGYYPQSTGSSSSAYGTGSSLPVTPGTPSVQGTSISRGRPQQLLTPNKRSSSPNPQIITNVNKPPLLSFIPSPTLKTFGGLESDTLAATKTAPISSNTDSSNLNMNSNSKSVEKKTSVSSPAIHILTKSFTRTLSDFSPSSSDNEERSVILTKLKKIPLGSSLHRSSSSVSQFQQNSISLLPKLTVLVFEPIPIHRYSITRDLKEIGCIVFSCASGSELIKLTSSNLEFDIIFASSESQKLNSVDLVKLIRHTNSLNSNSTMVALTTYSKDTQAFGVFDYVIEYPITRKKLKDIIKSVENNRANSEEAIVTDTE